MKFIVFLLVALLNFVNCFAMPVLNPAEPALLNKGVYFSNCEDWGIKLGYRGDFIFDRKFSNDITDIDDFEIYANEVVVSLTVWDRIDIYGFGGPACYNFTSFNQNPSNFIQGGSNTKTIWGTGLKIIVFKHECSPTCATYLTLDGQYEGMATNPLKWAILNDQQVSKNNFGYYYREAQVSLGLAQKIGQFIPYIAAKWSNGRLSINHQDVIGTAPNDVVLDKLKSDNHWGYVVGLSYDIKDKMLLTAEARFIDETALSIAFSFRF